MQYLIGHPKNAKNDEYCGAINTLWPEKYWYDIGCTLCKAHYICKKTGGYDYNNFINA